MPDKVENPDENYRDDLIVTINGQRLGVQVEVKTGWNGNEFPFPNMHIPKSKVDNALKHYKEVWFMIFNNDCSAVGLIKAKSGQSLKLIAKLNVYSKDKPEPFYEFSLQDIEFFDLMPV